jgi:hypothetical protein
MGRRAAKKKFDWQSFRDRMPEPSLSILLVLQILLIFVVAPFNESMDGRYRWMIDIMLALMSCVSVVIVRTQKIRRMVILLFAASTVRLMSVRLLPSGIEAETVSALFHVLFILTVSGIIGHKMMKDGPVTMHRIRGAIAIYLNIAILFALLDEYLLAFDLQAYNLNGSVRSLGTMVYFSPTTLTSTGYGDIVSVHPTRAVSPIWNRSWGNSISAR